MHPFRAGRAYLVVSFYSESMFSHLAELLVVSLFIACPVLFVQLRAYFLSNFALDCTKVVIFIAFYIYEISQF